MSDNSPIDPELVRELAAILNETDLFEVEVRHGDLKLRLSRGPSGGSAPVYAAAPQAPAPQPAAPSAPAAAPAPAASESAGVPDNAVTSPMVGTVYLRPSPDESAFKSPGDTVAEGDTILLIEAMKTFNPITAPRSGTLSRVLVSEGQPVEFGEPLFVIE